MNYLVALPVDPLFDAMCNRHPWAEVREINVVDRRTQPYFLSVPGLSNNVDIGAARFPSFSITVRIFFKMRPGRQLAPWKYRDHQRDVS